MTYTRHLPLVAALLLSHAVAQTSTDSARPRDDAGNRYLIISKEHPSDSRGEVVYSQETTLPEGAQLISGTFVVPRLLQQKEPKYPHSMRRHKAAGSVTLECVVTPQGDVIDLQVLKADVPPESVKEAGDNAIEAVRKYRFSPATLDAKPVAMYIRVSVQYRILDQ